MEEKIKIYLNKEIYNILLKDMELFEFYKSNKQLNKNDFLNTLIINYYETYQNKNNILFDKINKLTNDDHISNEILNIFEQKTYNLEDKFNKQLSVKPTKESSHIFDFIYDELLKDNTLSNYFRTMFASYCLLPQDKREQIIFKQQYEAINDAINLDKQIYFYTKGKNIKHIVSPYSITNSKEELFNYLIGQCNKKIYTFRLSRINKVITLKDKRIFNKDYIKVFENMKKYSPQFLQNTDEKEVCVILSKLGIDMFRKIYVHRPHPIKIDGNKYYFDCSFEQLFQYFTRFGNQAYIEYPIELRNRFISFYNDAFKIYDK